MSAPRSRAAKAPPKKVARSRVLDRPLPRAAKSAELQRFEEALARLRMTFARKARREVAIAVLPELLRGHTVEYAAERAFEAADAFLATEARLEAEAAKLAGGES